MLKEEGWRSMQILYIGSAGRSGSTLLEMILGNLPGMFSVGEILDFWEFLDWGNKRCGCGELLSECSFWTKVKDQLEINENFSLSYLVKLKQKLDRTRNLALLPMLRYIFQKEFNDLVSNTSNLYQIVSELTEGKVIVDSSKTPSHLYLLSQIPNADIRVLHLIRDPRGVATSWKMHTKNDRGKIHSISSMVKRPILNSIIRWSAENTYTHYYGQRQTKYTMMRYEDFTEKPYEELHRALQNLGILGVDLNSLKSSVLKLNSTHSVGGNPIRFQRKALRIKNENSWEKEMPKWQIFLFGLLANAYKKKKYLFLKEKKEIG